MGFFEVLGYILTALAFCTLGAIVSEFYNKRAWMKYFDGMAAGCSMRKWKEAAARRTVLMAEKKEGADDVKRVS